jgi:hypothetical protein
VNYIVGDSDRQISGASRVPKPCWFWEQRVVRVALLVLIVVEIVVVVAAADVAADVAAAVVVETVAAVDVAL